MISDDLNGEVSANPGVSGPFLPQEPVSTAAAPPAPPSGEVLVRQFLTDFAHMRDEEMMTQKQACIELGRQYHESTGLYIAPSSSVYRLLRWFVKELLGKEFPDTHRSGRPKGRRDSSPRKRRTKAEIYLAEGGGQ